MGQEERDDSAEELPVESEDRATSLEQPTLLMSHSGAPPPPLPEPLASVGLLSSEPPLPMAGDILAERYTVLQVIGQGGMGVVVAAYDSKLDRRVALKLLRSGLEGTLSGTSLSQPLVGARLVREAQAMARLNHPNVVHVYDTGTLEDGRLFIEMEYVEGKTLRQWCQEQQRPWREVLQAFIAAGRGLAAAHAVGLIHRDFKPDNVLLGDDGRVRVTDFGAARTESLSSSAASPAAVPLGGLPLLPQESTWETQLTLPGRVLGTPKYMAPEVLKGQAADARSDLFAFCVSLYEALYGQPAFSGQTAVERARAQIDGRVNPPPAQSNVPGWVARAVLRGLEVEPQRRPESMLELLRELEDDPEVRRRSLLRGAALATVVGVLAGLAIWGWTRQREQGPQCTRFERRWEQVWDEAARGRVRQSFLGTGLPYAQDTYERVAGALDAYTRRWVELRREACEAGSEQAGGPQSLAVLEVNCLERRHRQVQVLAELLVSGPDKELVPRAAQVVQSLPPLEDCTNAQLLTAAVPLPEDPAVRARAEELQQRVDRLEALHRAGKYKEGLKQGEALLQEVAQVEHAPLRASTLYWVARLRDNNGDYKGAEALMREAIPLASRGKDDVLVVRAWAHMLHLVGTRQARYPEAQHLELTLQAAVERSGNERAGADSLHTLGNLYLSMGQLAQARAHLERALELRQKLLGPRHPEVASSLNILSGVLYAMGDYPQARVLTERTLALRRDLLGAEHPEVASTLGNLANVLDSLGEYEQARKHLEEALALRQKLLGAEDPQIASLLSNLAQTLRSLGQYEQAQTHLDRVLELQQKLLGAEHPTVASSLVILGQVLWQRGRHEEARKRLERALALLEKGLGPQHPSVAFALDSLGGVLSSQGRHAQARARQERALALLEKQLGPDQADLAPLLRNLGRTLVRLRKWEPAWRYLERARALQEKDPNITRPDLVETLLGLGELHLAQGRPAEAVPLLERALAPAPAAVHAEVQFTLARALWGSGQDRARALVLATQAREHYQRTGYTPGLTEVSRWLATHPRP